MAAPAPLQVQSYQGPSCPRCHARLTADWIQSGTIICPDCNKPFEATAFRPPQHDSSPNIPLRENTNYWEDFFAAVWHCFQRVPYFLGLLYWSWARG